MTKQELAEYACHQVLEAEPTNYCFRSMLKAIRVHPNRYPTPKQWFWIKAKIHELAEQERHHEIEAAGKYD